jgi:hypothetical protein
MKWQPISKVPPPENIDFALTYDGGWIKARLNHRGFVIAERNGIKTGIALSELRSQYWLEIPPPPKDWAYADYVEAKVAGELD